ncbi:MAG: nucleoside kinase [Armatimonadetes bacterium]|nr:nucleoside kinase [Armatimonadota bacterium]
MEKIKINFGNEKIETFNKGTSLLEISRSYRSTYPIIAAKVNNVIKELGTKIYQDSQVSFVDLSNEDGIRIYSRGLSFILVKAAKEIFPEKRILIEHSLNNGLFCEFLDYPLQSEEVKKIYSCDEFTDYFYGYMVPSTGYLNKFELHYYPPGFILRFPHPSTPLEIPPFIDNTQLAKIFHEYKIWGRILKVENAGDLNNIIAKGEINELIRIAEALHEKKIAQIADLIFQKKENLRLILIAGPSSSGKTTFAQRLSIQLKVACLKPIPISLDDYFLDRELTPRDEKGEYDLESIKAIDLELFNKHLAELIQGKEVEIPRYDFISGKRKKTGRKIKISQDNLLLIEGIHALNEELTKSILRENKYKIYISALTQLNLDDHNRNSTTDSRIIRRIVRDYQFRGHSALETLKMWPAIKKGEEKNIFPFQEEADIMFNSALVYETAVLRNFAEPLLREIEPQNPEYSEVKRLLSFIEYFLSASTKEVPPNSILKEFIGGSIFSR